MTYQQKIQSLEEDDLTQFLIDFHNEEIGCHIAQCQRRDYECEDCMREWLRQEYDPRFGF